MFETIAMLTMFIEHLGKILFPDLMIFYLVGRLAIPLYTYGIVQGFKYTKSIKKYFLRLVMVAVISQFFYTPLFQTSKLNIIFTFLTALTLFILFKKTKINPLLKYIFIFLTAWLTEILQLEAGSYVIFLAFIYLSNKNLLIKHLLLNLTFFFLLRNNIAIIQFISLTSTLLIIFVENKPLKGLSRDFYRIFYPLHLAVLLILEKIIN